MLACSFIVSNFSVSLEIVWCVFSNSVFLFKIFFAFLSSLHFHMNLGIILSISIKTPAGILIGTVLVESMDQFEKN